MRHVKYIARKKDQQWSKVVKEKDIAIREKSKEVQVRLVFYSFPIHYSSLEESQPTMHPYQTVTKIAQASNAAASLLLQQKHELMQIADAKLNAQRDQHNATITNLKQHHSFNIAKKNEQLKAVEGDVKDYIDMAFEMTDEVTQSKIVAASASKNEKALQELARARLTRLHQTQESVDALRESLDTMREEMTTRLDAALKENESLKCKLAQSH